MTMYGLYIRDLAADDFVWFNTGKSLEPGAYLHGRHRILGRHHAHSPDVYVAESIPALVLQVGPLIQKAEDQAQSTLSTTDISSDTQQQIETKMTDGLLQYLTETSAIWVSNPDWLDDLQPVPASDS